MGAPATALRVLRAEGVRAVRDRALDRLEEARRRRSFRVAQSPPAEFRAPVLDLLATPPAPRLGGVQTQLLRRIEAQARERGAALLYPAPGGYRLELMAPDERCALALAGPPLPAPPVLDDAAFERVVLAAAAAAGAEGLHVEGLAGLPLASLLALHRRGLPLSLSLHDFAAFCPRPHLLERPALAFCHYSRDAERCARCLARDWPVGVGWQEGRRALVADLLAAAESLAYPSEFLRRTVLELFPALDPSRLRVVSPEPVATPARRRTARHPPRHVAYVGSVLPHKGALVFEEVVRRLGRGGAAGVRWSAYGGGDAALLARLRRLPGVRVRGYYRSGSLPRLLAADEVDLALLLSIVPESYGFTLSECRAAGVPVVAFDLGALGERVRAEGGGTLVPLADGAAGVAARLGELLRG
jgi:glycosyltransferase involved in cell wall biosynthesis